MGYKLTSIRPQEIIIPGNYSSWYSNDRTTVYFLQTLSHLEVESRKNIKRLEVGDIVIGKNFRIKNSSQDICSTRSISFKCSSENASYLNERCITDLTEEEGINDIVKIFDEFIINKKLIENAEKQFSKLCNPRDLRGQSTTKDKSDVIDKRLISVNRYLRKNYNTPLSLDVLAKMVHSNPVYLSNMYSKVFKISPMRHLQCIRMEKAAERLGKTNISIGEISEQLGYLSNSQFSTMFKRYYKMTPMQYRRLNQLNKIEDK